MNLLLVIALHLAPVHVDISQISQALDADEAAAHGERRRFPQFVKRVSRKGPESGSHQKLLADRQHVFPCLLCDAGSGRRGKSPLVIIGFECLRPGDTNAKVKVCRES